MGILSSRLGHDLAAHRTWFTVLRAACMKVDPQRELLLTAGTTTAQRFVQRCGQLFGLDVLQLDLPRSDADSVQRWLQAALRNAALSAPACSSVSVSPPLAVAGEPPPEALAGLPAADRAIAAGSQRLIALHVRGGGHVDRLLRARLADPAFAAATVYLALGPGLVPAEVAGELMTQGAVGWCVLNALGEPARIPELPPSAGAADARPAAPIVALADLAGDGYVAHCTRQRRGPWPDESREQFLDDLILDRAGADHSPLAALWRIVHSRRLIATASLIRGDVPVVSFTAVPVGELGRLHTFRPHLGRWDFEPYGIAVRREWLMERGGRPVIYGDETRWQELPEADRPFFQPRESRSASGRVSDWTVEREWRHVGDVPLDALPPEAAFVFVPTAEEAEQLAPASRWPIAVLQ